MSPDEEKNLRSDLWSLGAMILDILNVVKIDDIMKDVDVNLLDE